MKLFEQELNYSNKLGSGGEVAKGYYGLINELWNGTSSYLNPGDFRFIFIKFARQVSLIYYIKYYYTFTSFLAFHNMIHMRC